MTQKIQIITINNTEKKENTFEVIGENLLTIEIQNKNRRTILKWTGSLSRLKKTLSVWKTD